MTHRTANYRFRQWLADVPLVSIVLLKPCYSDAGNSVVHAEWRWRRCPSIAPREDVT